MVDMMSLYLRFNLKSLCENTEVYLCQRERERERERERKGGGVGRSKLYLNNLIGLTSARKASLLSTSRRRHTKLTRTIRVSILNLEKNHSVHTANVWLISINSHIPWFAIIVVWSQANNFQSNFSAVYFTKTKYVIKSSCKMGAVSCCIII